MPSPRSSALLALFVSVLVNAAPVSLSAAEPVARELITFGTEFALDGVTRNDSQVALTGTAEHPALSITTKAGGSWPGATIPLTPAARDVSAYEFLTLDLHNCDSQDIDIFVRVDNPGANGHEHCMTERIGTQPDQRVTLTIPLKRTSHSPIKLFGMQGYPLGLQASDGIDPSNIIAVTVFIEDKPARSHTFEVAAVRAFGAYQVPPWAAMTPAEFFPCIDRFGQFRHREWPGKIHSEDELIAARECETAALAADKGPAEWDAWGGWLAGPQLEATGHFRTAKHEGRWWLVDPDGRLFFSTGLTGVGPGAANTPLDDRLDWFADLPAKDALPFGAFRRNNGPGWGGGYYAGKSPEVYDFSSANLLRKYGADWAKTYTDVLHRRLRTWGINTLGNWSSNEVAAAKRTPYTRTFWYDCPKLKKSGFPDVFDPAFAAGLAKGAKQFLGGTTDDPWCLGYFVDNEMAWGGDSDLARRALASPGTTAAKRAFATWLQEHYSTTAALNTAWGTTWASWDAFTADTAAKPTTPAATADLVAFTGLTADTYFKGVQEVIRAIAPHKLYLGCRSVGGAGNLAAAAAKYCDVVSYNRYCASVRDIRLPDGLDAPVMIGEFHFGGLDRGLFWSGLFAAENQEDRGRKFTTYVDSALDNPQIVGVHWFQYGDEATTGRIDGENAQCGFVDVCDSPYPETIKAARAVGDAMYQRRAGGAKP